MITVRDLQGNIRQVGFLEWERLISMAEFEVMIRNATATPAPDTTSEVDPEKQPESSTEHANPAQSTPPEETSELES